MFIYQRRGVSAVRGNELGDENMLEIIAAVLSPMDLILRFSIALQVIAAFVIFLFAFVALFVSLIISLAIAKGIYEGAKGVRAYAVRSASAKRSISSEVEAPAHREKSFVVPAWRQGLVEGSVGGRNH
jgi:hypothetical protein